jgi:hypothetical protein
MPRHPRLPILLAIVSALFLRALVPAGWMPAPDRGAFAIEPCPAADAALLVHGAGHHGGGKHDPAHKTDHGGDCAFSPLQAGFAPAEAPAVVTPPALELGVPASFIAGPMFKTGPPALLPPATGPPAIA